MSPRSKEELRRRRRSLEHMSHRSSGNRERRSSDEAMCECWECRHKLERSIEAMEDPMKTGRRRMRVQATWTPRSRAASRESGLPRSRTSSPTGHNKVLPDGTSIPIKEWRRREARDEIQRETKKPVMKESRILERTRCALMREIRSGAKEL